MAFVLFLSVGWVYGACYELQPNFSFSVPCVSYQGNYYNVTFEYYPNVLDLANHYWKLVSAEPTSAGDECIAVGEDLSLSFPCFYYKGMKFTFNLSKYDNPSDSSSFYFKSETPLPCVSVDETLTLNLPAVQYNGTQYEVELSYYDNPTDEFPFYWKLGAATPDDDDIPAIQLGEDLRLNVPCAAYYGAVYGLGLDYYPNPNDASNHYWKLKDLTQRFMDISNFKKVSISSGFEFEILKGSYYMVEFTTDVNIQQFVQIRKNGDTLSIGLSGDAASDTSPRSLVIVMPALEKIELSGAANGTFSGFTSANMEIIMSGAGRLEGTSGSIYNLKAMVSGSSKLTVRDIQSLASADVTLSGLSEASMSVRPAGNVSGSLSSMSTLYCYGDGINVNVDADESSAVYTMSPGWQLLALVNGARSQERYCSICVTQPQISFTCESCPEGNCPPASSLVWNDKLAAAAYNHSAAMAEYQDVAVEVPEGTTVSDRITDSGYERWAYGTSIGAGYETAQEALNTWIEGASCSTLMYDGFVHLGASMVNGVYDGIQVKYWTLILAAPYGQAYMTAGIEGLE